MLQDTEKNPPPPRTAHTQQTSLPPILKEHFLFTLTVQIFPKVPGQTS